MSKGHVCHDRSREVFMPSLSIRLLPLSVAKCVPAWRCSLQQCQAHASSQHLLQWPKGLELPSMKSVTYLKTCLVWVLVFISPAQLHLMLHLLWLTSATAFKSPPLKEDYGMCCTHHGILTHQSVRNQYSPCQYFSTHP